MSQPVVSLDQLTTEDAEASPLAAFPFQARLLEAITEAAVDGILVVDAAGRIAFHNRRFAEMWGIPQRVLASRRDDRALAAVRSMLVDPDAFLARVEYLYLHPREMSLDEIRLLDGRVFDRHSAPVIDEQDVVRGRVWFFRDVTDVRRSHESNQLLARSGRLFGSSLDVDQTLAQFTRLIVPDMADWMAVDVLNEAGEFRRVAVAHVDPTGEELLHELDRAFPLRPNDGRLRGRVVATREPVALFDISDGDLAGFARNAEHLAMLRRLGIGSALWIPLLTRDRVMGVMSVGYRPGGRRYLPADLDLLRELGHRAALAVDNALLFRAIDRAERRQATVSALGQRALAGAPLSELFAEAAQQVAATIEVPFSEVLELMPDGKRLRLIAGVGWRAGAVGSV